MTTDDMIAEIERRRPDLVVVRREPSIEMERAYFAAPLPPWKKHSNPRKRRLVNRKKMRSRWRAMVTAGSVNDDPLS